jgi:hypothetical protein
MLPVGHPRVHRCESLRPDNGIVAGVAAGSCVS